MQEEKDQDFDDFEKATRRGQQIRNIAIIVLFVLPTAFGFHRMFCDISKELTRASPYEETALSKKETTQLTKRAKALQNLLQKYRAAWKQELHSGRFKDKKAGSQECEHNLQAPSREAISYYIKEGRRDIRGFGNVTFRTYQKDQVINSEVLKNIQNHIRKIKTMLQSKRGSRGDISTLLQWNPRSYEIFVIAQKTKPVLLTLFPRTTFRSGKVQGKAYLHSHTKGRISCVGKFDAKNTPSFRYKIYMTDKKIMKKLKALQIKQGGELSPDQMKHYADELMKQDTLKALKADLYINTIKAVAEQLRTSN